MIKGVHHIAIDAPDIEAKYARRTTAGMTLFKLPVEFGSQQAIFGRELFGNIIDLPEKL